MAKNEVKDGNPNIGMSEESFDAAETKSTSGSSDFFSRLENDVNGGIQDNTEVTQSQPKVNTKVDTGSKTVKAQSENRTDWEKRYKDSSREAVKWRDRFQEIEKFSPILEAMKNDSGLVDTVRDYLKNGGKPAKSIQEELKLDEDFIFDQQEAMTNPDSDSAKVMNAHVDTMVQQRVGQMLQAEKQRNLKIQKSQDLKSQEKEFQDKNNMSEEEFNEFKSKAQSHKMTLDDIHFLLNRDKTAQNVAKSTQEDMLKQMKNVRNMPTSASSSNSQGESKSEDRQVFESIMGFDNKTDNLFG